MPAGVEPEPEQTHGDAGAEEKGQDPAPARSPAEQREQAGQQGHCGVGQRHPGGPRAAERLAMFEAHLAEQERCAAQQGARDALVAIAHAFPGHGLTTISPAISSCPLPQKMSQWKGKFPALSDAMRTRVTLPGSMFSSIFRSGTWKPCLRSSVVSSSTTGWPSLSSMTAGLNLNAPAATGMTFSCAFTPAAANDAASRVPVAPRISTPRALAAAEQRARLRGSLPSSLASGATCRRRSRGSRGHAVDASDPMEPEHASAATAEPAAGR